MTHPSPINEQGIFLARLEADGTPDLTFGRNGTTQVTMFAQTNRVNNTSPAVAIASDGKIVVARTIVDLFPGNQPGTRVAVARFDRDGALDPTFGLKGIVYTTLGNHFEVWSVAVQRDDKVIVAGQSGHLGNCLEEACTRLATLVRYQANGQLDGSFGLMGAARPVFLVGGPPAARSPESYFTDLFVQENGLIVATGQVQIGSRQLVNPTKMLVVEFLPTGELNPGFGQGGAVSITFDGPYQKFGGMALAFRENGKILVGGAASRYSTEGNSTGGSAFLIDQAMALV